MRISDWSSDVCSSDLRVEGSELCRLLEGLPSVVLRLADELVLHRRVAVARDRRIAAIAIIAALARRRPVGEDALAVAHRLADRRTRRLHLRPDASDERLRRFAARNVHLVEALRLLAELVHDRSEEHTSELQSLMRTSY